MIFINILILIVAKALPSSFKNFPPILFPRITAIIFIYAGALSFNTLYIQSIGSGIGIYSGLFHITVISQFIEVFIFLTGSLILITFTKIKTQNISKKIDNIPNINSIKYLNYYLILLCLTFLFSFLFSYYNIIFINNSNFDFNLLSLTTIDNIINNLNLNLLSIDTITKIVHYFDLDLWSHTEINKIIYFSTLFNTTCLFAWILGSIIESGFLGYSIKIYAYNLNYKFYIQFFIFVFIFFSSLKTLYLDEPQLVQVNVEGTQIYVSGDILNHLFDKFGDATVFVAGLKIGHAISSKFPITQKILTTGFTASVCTFIYRERDKVSFEVNLKEIGNKIYHARIQNVQINTNTNTNINTVENLNAFRSTLGLDKYNLSTNINTNKTNIFNKTYNVINTKGESNLVNSLTSQNFNWKTELASKFTEQSYLVNKVGPSLPSSSNITQTANLKAASSSTNLILAPLEQGEIINIYLREYLIHNLTSTLSLVLCSLALIYSLFWMFTTKVILSNPDKIAIVKNWPLGNIIYKYLQKLLSFSSASTTIWIYLIIFAIGLTNLAILYWVYNIVELVKQI